ncbi:MAG: MFS transporter [Pseudomonadota bacterium]
MQPKLAEQNYPPAWLSWTVWSLGAAFYLIGFYQRVAPAVMTAELMRDFDISAAALGNLSACYLYAYVAMQIPTGILADALGPRKLLSAGCLVAGLGSLLFGLGPGLFWANLGRLMIGGSVAVAFVALLKVASHWFAPRRFALASGLALFWGIMGAVTAGVPLRLMVDAFGWRGVMVAVGVITVGLGAVIWLFVRDDPSQKGYASLAAQFGKSDAPPIRPLAGLKRIFAYRNTWLLCLAPSGQAGPILAFAGLWGVPYLQARFGLSRAEGAALCSAMLTAWALSGPLCGALSDRIGQRKPIYLAGGIIGTLGWAAMLYLPVLPLMAFIAIGLLVGLGTGSMILGFAFGKESVPAQLAGTSAGVINMGTMLGPTILQPAIGAVLDLLWSGGTADGVRVYSVEAYDTAFVLMLAWSIVSCLLLFFTRETHCRQLNES